MNNIISVLLIDEQESNYYKIKELFNQIHDHQFIIEFVNNFEQAKIANNFRNYDAFLINFQINNYIIWARNVYPKPVILLTQDSNIGNQALIDGISDYLLEEELSAVLIKHSLRLSIAHSQTKKEFQHCQIDCFYEDKNNKNKVSKDSKEKILHTIFDNSTDGILIVNQEGIICFCNKTATNLLNKPFSKLIGENFGHPTITEKSVEIEIVNPDLTISILEMTKGNSEWEGKPATVIMIRDVTLEKRQEQELEYFYEHLERLAEEQTVSLRETETRFIQLAENIDSVFWITLIDNNKFIYVSPAYEKIWGKSCNDIYESNSVYLDSIHPEDKEKVILNFAQQREGKETEIEYRIFDNQGNLHWINTRSYPVFNEENNLERIAAISDDITARKLAEEALRNSEIRYRNLVDTLPGIIYSFSSLKGNIYFSQQVESILGYTIQELQENPWLWNNSIHPEDVDLATQAIYADISGEKFAIEYRIRDKQGNWHWFFDCCITIKHIDNEIIIDGLALDITDRKQMEINIKRSESSLKEAQRIAQLGNWSYNIKTHECYWSDQVYTIFGKNKRQFILTYDSFLQSVHREDRGRVDENIKKSISTPQEYQIRYRIQTDEEEIKYVQEYGSYNVDEEGEMSILKGTVQDITMYQKKEEALRRSEAGFRSIFEQAAVGIAIISPSGKIQRVNPKLCEFLEYNPSELTNVSWQEIIHSEDFRQTLKLTEKILRGEISSFSLDQRYFTKHCQGKWANITITLERDIHNNPIYFICIIDDIDARKQTETMLKQAKESADEANMTKSIFLANISHELRTPLNGILGFTQLMNISDELSEQHQKYVKIINNAGEHLLSLINEILDLSKIEAGELKLNVECFDLYDLLSAIEQIFVIKIATKNLELLIIKEHNLPQYIKTDQSKLRSIITNLIANAIKFTHQGSIQVRVSSQKINSKIKLIVAVEDTGVGINPKEINDLFKIFTQTKNGKKSGEGSGLGLAISKRFVKLMGGDIQVSSELNKGTIFTFNIICKLGDFQEINQSKFTSYPVKVKLKLNQPEYRILIVEDDQSNLELLQQLLQPHFAIQSATNGEEALKLWQTWQPHLIMMDIKMPVMDGYEAIKKIRQQEKNNSNDTPAVKIIACTASTFESDKQYLLEIGSDDFFGKPFNVNELWRKLETNLGVEFDYQPQCNNDSIILNNHLLQLKIEDLSFMGYEWREKFYYAVLSARKERILELIKKIPTDKQEIIKSLEFLLNQLNFEELMRLANLDEN